MRTFPLLLLSLLAPAITVQQVPNPRDQGRWVTDMVDALSAEEARDINATLTAVEQSTGVEIALVLVQDVPGTPKEFATELFNHWHIGKQEADNGLLVLMVMGQRRLEMETGYGLEPVLPDGWLGQMQQTQMVPLFKAGKIGQGLVAGIHALVVRIEQSPEEAREGSRNAPVMGGVKKTLKKHGKVLKVAGTGVGGAGLLAGVVALQTRRRRRQRTCDNCKTEMEKLPESREDKHLTPAQQMEERIGSILYDVYWCRACSFTRVLSDNKWFSGFGKCSSCGHKTMKSTSTTLQAATYDHGGLVRVHEHCRFCKRDNTYTRNTPRLQRSTSSSSGSSGGRSSGGGGGSFGGGSSGGGGAGSSW